MTATITATLHIEIGHHEIVYGTDDARRNPVALAVLSAVLMQPWPWECLWPTVCAEYETVTVDGRYRAPLPDHVADALSAWVAAGTRMTPLEFDLTFEEYHRD